VSDPSLQAMADELKCTGMERRDHLERLEKLGKYPAEVLALKRLRLETFRAAYRKFLELARLK
jgi:predicted ArsR family transcriptional regulator